MSSSEDHNHHPVSHPPSSSINGHHNKETSGGSGGLRNFRSCYYERVGLKAVDESKALESVLHGPEGAGGKVHHVDLTKVANITSRFPLPHVYRERIWMLLLGLVPPVSHFDLFILSEQKKLCHDLHRCLYLLNLVVSEDEEENEEEEEVSARAKNLVLMYLLETEQLDIKKNLKDNLDSVSAKRLLSMAQVLSDLTLPFDHDYWLLKEFIRLLSHINVLDLTHKILNEISQEDHSLYQHLESLSCLSTSSTGDSGTASCSSLASNGSASSSASGSPVNSTHFIIPFDSWFSTCFAGFITGCFLIKIWDRVVSPPSSLKILSLMAKNLIILHKKEILETKDANQIRKLLLQVRLEFKGMQYIKNE